MTAILKPGQWPPSGDMGLGLCLMCLAAAKQAPPDQRPAPQFAIALVPHMQPFPNGMVAVVAIGACWDHIGRPEDVRPRRLLVAQGGV